MKSIVTFIFSILLLISHNATAKGVQWDLLASTPVGSWQLREELETNHKGKQTANLIRTSMLASEERDGEMHYWVETSMQTYKIKKNGKRKTKGKPVVIKTLLAESLFQSDPSNAMQNLQGFGAEVIIQNGKDKPMRLSNTGGIMEAAANIMNLEINYDFSEQGNESVEVEAGTFDARKIAGAGNTQAKVLFQKIKVESEATIWISSKVPFGTVKMEDQSVTNGKTSQIEGRLLEYGMSGAKSEIQGEIQDAPEMPKLNDLFGG